MNLYDKYAEQSAEASKKKDEINAQKILSNTKRSVMAKKFKINDGSSKYVETATLLEPANNSATN